MDLASPDVLWILILGFIIGFFLAFGVGANDVANSFGTSVGAKVLTLKQACILATIFEILGSILLGHKVSSTIRTELFDVEMYSEFEKELMLGYLAALCGSAIWNLVATFFRWPISGTHSIVGAVVGFSLVSRGFYSIKWMMLGKIVASWFLSPVLSGLLSSGIYLIVKTYILSKDNVAARGYISLPFFYAFTVFINVFSVVHKGPHYLRFDEVPWWGVFILAFGVGLIVGLCIWYILVPYLRQDSSHSSVSDGSEIQIQKHDANSLSDCSVNQLKKDANSTSKEPTKEGENPCFEATNGHSLPMVEVNIHDHENSHVCTIENDDKKDISLQDLKSGDDSAETVKMFSSLQVLTAIFGSFAHGANDVSNAIGPVIALWLIYIEGSVSQSGESPFWIMMYGGVGISIGLWVWGQKVIKTIGEDLTKITPSSGFTIEIGAATTVLLASKIGLPISTTHCKVGSVVFVGWTRSKSAVDWKLFRNIILAWVLTLPVSGGLSGMMMAILRTATNS